MYKKLEMISRYNAADYLANEMHAYHADYLNAFVALGGDVSDLYFYSDYNKDPNIFPIDFYDPKQDDEKPNFGDWKEFCGEWNKRKVIDTILDKFGITQDWYIDYIAGKDVIVRTPGFEHIPVGRTMVYLPEDEEDPEDRSGDYNYTESLASEVADGAISGILSPKSTAREKKISQLILLQLESL